MNKNIKLSIILPAYNGEIYISDMIESVLAQTYKYFELIIVNDGSKDSTLEICEKYAQKDSRITVINQTNKGICGARNTGLEAANGEYIGFLDQDDKIKKNMFEQLIYHIEKNNADMVISGKCYIVVKQNGSEFKETIVYKDELIDDKNNIKKLMFNRSNSRELVTIWNCLYRSKIIKENSIQFDSTFKFGGEDNIFNVEYASYCKSIYITSDVFYQYFQRSGFSTSTKFNNNYLNTFLYFLKKIYDFSVKDTRDESLLEEYYNMFFMSIITAYYYYLSHQDMSKNDKLDLLKFMCNLDEVKIFFSRYRLLPVSRGRAYNLYLKFIYILMKSNKYNLLSNVLDACYKVKEDGKIK